METSFIFIYVFYISNNEKKEQIVNILGQIRSEITFNTINIIEYFCCMIGPENQQIVTF